MFYHMTVHDQKTQENMPGEAQINMNPFKDKNCRQGRIPVTSSIHVDQGCPNSVLEGRCPAEFNANPN